MNSTSKFCGECGGRLSEGAGFCGKCGTAVSGFQNKQQETAGSPSGIAQNQSKSNFDKIKFLAMIFVLLLLVYLLGGLSLFTLISPIVLFLVLIWGIWRGRSATRIATKEKD